MSTVKYNIEKIVENTPLSFDHHTLSKDGFIELIGIRPTHTDLCP